MNGKPSPFFGLECLISLRPIWLSLLFFGGVPSAHLTQVNETSGFHFLNQVNSILALSAGVVSSFLVGKLPAIVTRRSKVFALGLRLVLLKPLSINWWPASSGFTASRQSSYCSDYSTGS